MISRYSPRITIRYFFLILTPKPVNKPPRTAHLPAAPKLLAEEYALLVVAPAKRLAAVAISRIMPNTRSIVPKVFFPLDTAVFFICVDDIAFINLAPHCLQFVMVESVLAPHT